MFYLNISTKGWFAGRDREIGPSSHCRFAYTLIWRNIIWSNETSISPGCSCGYYYYYWWENNLLIFMIQPNHREGRTTSSKQLNAGVQYNGGLLPDIILLTLCDYIGEAFRYHEEFLSLEPTFPPVWIFWQLFPWGWMLLDLTNINTNTPPVISTCPLHNNSGCGKERRILIGPWWPAKAALVLNYLDVYWPCAGGLSAVNAIGTQLRDPINLGLTRWRMAVS